MCRSGRGSFENRQTRPASAIPQSTPLVLCPGSRHRRRSSAASRRGCISGVGEVSRAVGETGPRHAGVTRARSTIRHCKSAPHACFCLVIAFGSADATPPRHWQATSSKPRTCQSGGPHVERNVGDDEMRRFPRPSSCRRSNQDQQSDSATNRSALGGATPHGAGPLAVGTGVDIRRPPHQ